MSTPASPESSSRLVGDERMTAEREETKYLLSPEAVAAMIAVLNARLSPHRFVGEGANHLPDPHHFVTSIYFDTPGRSHFQEAVADGLHNVKIRAKEYYDLHPSLAELATDPAQIVRYQPWIWFELKRREGARTLKSRFRLPKREVPAFLAGQRGVSDAVAPGGPALSEREKAGIAEIVRHCQALSDPLVAACLVNYRRRSWQDPAGALRVTLDAQLAFFAPPADLWQRDQALVRSELGTALARERRAVLEVKHIGSTPAWLDEALGMPGVTAFQFSKFLVASEAVHGRV
ncbi:MAG: VTC domain-containing protein [Verrucomicrobiota bacterium]